MKKGVKYSGVFLATTAVALILNTSSISAATTPTPSYTGVKCYGINSCKGKSQCGLSNKNSCQGLNACKGKGYLYVKTEKECLAQGGKIK
jgi:hypothetical protein